MGQLSKVFIWRLCGSLHSPTAGSTTTPQTRWKISDKLLNLFFFFSQHHVSSLLLSIFTSLSFSLRQSGFLMRLLVPVRKELQFDVNLLSCSGAIWHRCDITVPVNATAYKVKLSCYFEFLCPGIHKQLTVLVLMGRVIFCQLAILDIWYLIRDTLPPSVQIVMF